MKTALVLGGTGFIGHHLARKLKSQGYWVRVVDIRDHRYGEKDYADDYQIKDMTMQSSYCIFDRVFDEVYQLAADMGGAGYIFTGENDANVMCNSALINLNILGWSRFYKKIFYSSSACMYPQYNQLDPDNPNCAEDSAYPAQPDSEYGWEKLFSERLYMAFNRNYGVDVRIARFHNIFGEEGAWNNGKEKFPAAVCRKVAQAIKNTALALDGSYIEIWGDGKQTRSFLYIDECLEGIERLMKSDCKFSVNIGSDEMIAVNDLAKMVIEISGKDLAIKNVKGAEGVRGRNSDNTLIYKTLGWKPTRPLREGMEKLYEWINFQVNG